MDVMRLGRDMPGDTAPFSVPSVRSTRPTHLLPGNVFFDHLGKLVSAGFAHSKIIGFLLVIS